MSERRSTTSRQRQPVELNVSSDPANLATVRKAIEAFASSSGFDERAVAEIGLCVNEAMANVIRHAYRGRHDRPVQVTAGMDESAAPGESIVITLRDWGSGINPSCVPQRPRDPLQPGGIGLICLRQWMDEIDYAPQPDGGVLATMKRRRR